MGHGLWLGNFMSSDYLLFIVIPLILSIWAQMSVSGAFRKYSRIANSAGMTGAQAAQYMLRAAGLEGSVGIERVSGRLSDHYDPRSRVLRLSQEIHDGRSIASLAVACHEAGHAVQHARNYAPLTLRNLIVPTASFGSSMGFFLIFIGLLFHPFAFLLPVGIALFAAVVVFQIVNLPVEFDASNRAKAMLGELGIVRGPQEAAGVRKMLNAAAMTYVAATIAAIAQLAYYILLNNRR